MNCRTFCIKFTCLTLNLISDEELVLADFVQDPVDLKTALVYDRRLLSEEVLDVLLQSSINISKVCLWNWYCGKPLVYLRSI